MNVAVATIFDNLANKGCLVQASAMLEIFSARGVGLKREGVWANFSENCGPVTQNYFNSLNVDATFVNHPEAAEHINANYDLLIVGSDELWKAGSSDDMFSLPYPNPYWGTGVKIPKIAFAVSTGSIDFAQYPKQTLKKMHDDLASFDRIYVRDRKSVRDLAYIGIFPDGVLPDPTFAIDFRPTNKLPDDDVTPKEWFASFANLEFCHLERMHKLLACLRGGTPCISTDPRMKSKELVLDFNLPLGSEDHVKKHWPYEEIARRCEDYRSQWQVLLKELGLGPDRSGAPSLLTEHETKGSRSSAILSSEGVIPKRDSQQASTTYLFDRQRSGRLKYGKGKLSEPQLIRSSRLPNDPPCSPESTAVFDEKGNSYFGCHDGYFYSLSDTGNLRWMYKTGAKIYSSPLLLRGSNHVSFASGDGWLYCLESNGNLVWKQQIGDPVNSFYSNFVTAHHKSRSHILHEVNRIASANAWASPNVLSNGCVCVSGYSMGLSAVNCETGELEWRVDLGKPSAHLSGVVIDDDESIYVVAQQGRVYKISEEGEIIWKRSLKWGFNSWGNPSLDKENGKVYVPVSRRENAAIIYAYDLNGNLAWKRRLPEGVRGAIGISREDYVLCCGFKGSLFFIDKKTGSVLKRIQVTPGKMWTSCAIDPSGYIFISVIDSSSKSTGRVCCYDKWGNFEWDFDIGKGHSVPVMDSQGRLYVGSWRGEYHCIQT